MKWEKGVQRYKLPVIKSISYWDVTYSMATAYVKAARKVNLKSSHKEK